MDIPNLLKVSNENDHSVDRLFIEMVRVYIQKNALREDILCQVPTIMVSNKVFAQVDFIGY